MVRPVLRGRSATFTTATNRVRCATRSRNKANFIEQFSGRRPFADAAIGVNNEADMVSRVGTR